MLGILVPEFSSGQTVLPPLWTLPLQDPHNFPSLPGFLSLSPEGLPAPKLLGWKLCIWVPRSCRHLCQGRGACHTAPGPFLVWQGDRKWTLLSSSVCYSNTDCRDNKPSPWLIAEGTGTSRSHPQIQEFFFTLTS